MNLNPTSITFIIYILGMSLIGLCAFFYTKNMSDYILGGRKLGSFITALSAGASDMSGWVLMGLPGAIFLTGLVNVWLALGLILGAYLNWLYVAGRLRFFTELYGNSLTLPEYLQSRFQSSHNILKVICALIILLFFTIYCSSGMVAGARLFENVFGYSYTTALWLTALTTIFYTAIGGFLAVSWSDTIQGSMMFLALIIVPLMVIFYFGGMGHTQEVVIEASQYFEVNYTNFISNQSWILIVSLFAWGLGYFGQPHILARFMAAESLHAIPNARRISMTWMIGCLIGAILVGYTGIAYFYENLQLSTIVREEHEQIFIELARKLFNPWVAGFLLSAILAAVMSTLSCQLLLCSSAITEDLYKGLFRKNAGNSELIWVGRLMVIFISIISIYVARDPHSAVLSLVAYAWAGFGSTFGPVILFSLYWKKVNTPGVLAALITGTLVVVLWKTYAISDIYEIIPGFISASLMLIVVSLLTQKISPPKEAEYLLAAEKYHQQK